jgi:hypothetical protein
MKQVAAVDPNRHLSMNQTGMQFFGGNRGRHRLRLLAAAILLTSCATTPSHRFPEPSPDWKTRSGQLLYRNAQTTLIGDVVVRFSREGDLDLVFSKGPGLTLLAIREDASFAQIKGPLAGRGWWGPIDRAPLQLRGWLGLRDQLVRAPRQKSVRYTSGTETFLFHF